MSKPQKCCTIWCEMIQEEFKSLAVESCFEDPVPGLVQTLSYRRKVTFQLLPTYQLLRTD